MDQLDGKTAFITGGAQGIGLGIARALAGTGVKLALADINAEALAAAKDELAERTPTETFQLDVRDRQRFADVADEAEAALGPVSLLFNNAGVASGVPVTEMTYEMWDFVFDINITGVANGIQTFVPRMIARGDGGYMVNTSSGAGLANMRAGFLYTASKYAVVGLSEAMQTELEPYGIGVSVLCPSFVATNIIESSAALNPTAGERERPGSPEVKERADAFKARGQSIDAVGEMVLAGIKADQLYIYTDGLVAKSLKRRNQALLDALPIDPARSTDG